MSTFLLTRGRYSFDWIKRFDSLAKTYEFSKVTQRIGKKLFQSSRTYAVKWQFLAKNQYYFCLPDTEIDLILNIKACYSILVKESNYRPDRVSDG
jgi:hypothetical protein